MDEQASLTAAVKAVNRMAHAAKEDADFLATAVAVLAGKLSTLKSAHISEVAASKTRAADDRLLGALELAAPACLVVQEAAAAMRSHGAEAQKIAAASQAGGADDLSAVIDRARGAMDAAAAKVKKAANADPFAQRQAEELQRAVTRLRKAVARSTAAEAGEEDEDEDELVTMDTFDEASHLQCPMTKKLPQHPVRNGHDARCSHVYDRGFVESFLGGAPEAKCPMCPAKWRKGLVMPDHARKVLLDLHLAAARAHKDAGEGNFTAIDDNEEDDDIDDDDDFKASSSSSAAAAGRRRRR